MKNLQRLCKTFNEASLALPHIIGIARPIGTGTYGLVIEHPDQTLTKILFRPRSVERTKFRQTLLVNELKALKLLAAHPVQDLQTPHLIGDVEFLRHKDYLAAFRMTKIEGTPCYLSPHNYDSAEILKEQHEKAGKALAKFHKASHQLPPGGVSKLPDLEYNKIFRVPYFSPEKNDALKKADDYLQTHKQSGIIHGDYHGGNILMDKNRNITGLIDFSHMRHSNNIYTDFVGIAPPMVTDFIHGYEQESGKTIDHHMVTATSLAVWTSYFVDYTLQFQQEGLCIQNINECLKNLAPVTGYTPT